MTERDWQRVAAAVRSRRESLGLRREDMTASASTVYKLETAAQDSYKSFALRKVEADLRWPAGAIDTIAEGGVIPGSDPALEQRLAALDERLTQIEEQLRRLALGER